MHQGANANWKWSGLNKDTPSTGQDATALKLDELPPWLQYEFSVGGHAVEVTGHVGRKRRWKKKRPQRSQNQTINLSFLKGSVKLLGSCPLTLPEFLDLELLELFILGKIMYIQQCGEETCADHVPQSGLASVTTFLPTMLVNHLHDEVEHNKIIIRFCLDRKYERHLVQKVVRQLRKTLCEIADLFHHMNVKQQTDRNSPLKEFYALLLRHRHNPRDLGEKRPMNLADEFWSSQSKNKERSEGEKVVKKLYSK
eukprot:Gb_34679 [translate_table: standard]